MNRFSIAFSVITYAASLGMAANLSATQVSSTRTDRQPTSQLAGTSSKRHSGVGESLRYCKRHNFGGRVFAWNRLKEAESRR